MIAALHGELVPSRQPQPPGEGAHDAYSLFYSRSSALGWLTPAEEGAAGGLWGMNDAEAGPVPGTHTARVAWFQVVLTEAAHTPLVLPVQAFLSCAGDVVARLGTLRLDGVSLLLPERDRAADGIPGSGRDTLAAAPLLAAAEWFADRERPRARLRVTLDSGPDPAIRAAAGAIMERVQAVPQDVFVCDSFSLTAGDHLELSPPIVNHGWPGATHHRVSLFGSLAEWSLDALGWLAAFLADTASRCGAGTALILTAGAAAASQDGSR